MKNFVCFILVFLCICANQTLLSQKINDSISTKILDEVIVSATKTLRQLSTLPLPAKLISKEEIIKSNSSRLSDILDDQIGIFVVPDFGGGNGIQMQGLDSEYTLVLIDGFPIIGRQSGTLDLERIAVGNIEKIEIIKGSSSGLYGTDAIGGVINLITKKTNEVVSLESSYKISSFNTNDWSINIGSSLKKGHSINAFFNTLNSDGYDLNDIEFLNTVEPYKNYTGFIRYNYENENLSVFSSYRIYHEDQEFKINKNIYGDNAINESSFITSINYKANDKLSLVIDNYHTKYKNEEALESYSLDYDESFFSQSLYKAELRSIYEINQKNKLILGIGYSEESLKRNNFFQDKVSQNSNNYFIQYEGFILENTNYIFGARYDQYDEYESEFSPRFALRTQLSNNLSSKFSIGKGFKTPDFRQLYFNFSNSNSGYSVVGFNAAKQIINDLLSQGQISNLIITESQFEGQLEPETSVSYNLGLNFKINTNISFDINLFKNQIKNLIDYKIIATKINGQNIFSYYNLDRAYTQGIEFNSTFKLNNNLSLNTGYQYLDSKENDVKKRIKSGEVYARVNTVSSSFKIKTDDYFGLFNRSKHNINTKITFIKDDFQIYFKTKYRSKYGLIDSNGNDILDNYDEFVKGNFISDISVSKKIKSLNITLGLDNIFNYKDPKNVPNNPGRVLYSKITITI